MTFTLSHWHPPTSHTFDCTIVCTDSELCLHITNILFASVCLNISLYDACACTRSVSCYKQLSDDGVHCCAPYNAIVSARDGSAPLWLKLTADFVPRRDLLSDAGHFDKYFKVKSVHTIPLKYTNPLSLTRSLNPLTHSYTSSLNVVTALLCVCVVRVSLTVDCSGLRR